MVRIILFFTLLQFCSLASHAQIDSLLSKSRAELYPTLTVQWLEHLVSGEIDSATAFQETQAIRDLAIKHQNSDLEMYSYVMEMHYAMVSMHHEDSVIYTILDKTLAKAVEMDAQWAKAVTEREYGILYYNGVKNYQLCFEHLYKMYAYAEPLDAQEFPEKANCMNNLGLAYYLFRNYHESIKYYRLAQQAALESYQLSTYVQNLNALGLCFQKLNQIDSSDHYFNIALDFAEANGITHWAGIVSGNLGYNNYLRGDYDAAIPQLKKDVALAIEAKDYGLAVGSLTPLAAIATKQMDLPKAKHYIDQALHFTKRSTQYRRYELLYPVVSEYYLKLGDQNKALAYMDSALMVKDSLARKFNQLLMVRAEQKLEQERHNEEIKTLELEKEKSRLRQNMIIAVLTAIMAMVVLILNIVWRRYRQKHQQLEAQEKELKSAKLELQNITQRLVDRNKLVEQLKHKAEDKEKGALLELQQSTILTSEDWENFQDQFEKVHAGYLDRLVEKCPQISQAEIRLVALSMLGISDTDKAAVLGVGAAAIRQYQSRLRRKLGLQTKEELHQWIKAV